MNAQPLRFSFRIERIRAAEGIAPGSFTTGHYKPPVNSHHYTTVGESRWFQWTMDGVQQLTAPPPPTHRSYSTSVFYDGTTERFLFHPDDCRTKDISAVELYNGERWGWQQLKFTHHDSDPNHSILDRQGEHATLWGRPGSYSPQLLPASYRSVENNTPCGMSGNFGLLLALTAFSCRADLIVTAVQWRLNLAARRWDSYDGKDWGTGRTHGLGVVVHICEHPLNPNLSTWEEGNHGALLM